VVPELLKYTISHVEAMTRDRQTIRRGRGFGTNGFSKRRGKENEKEGDMSKQATLIHSPILQTVVLGDLDEETGVLKAPFAGGAQYEEIPCGLITMEIP
jgi:hypothetical protein